MEALLLLQPICTREQIAFDIPEPGLCVVA